MFKGAIFDVDGTLLDSMDAWEGMTSRFLNRLNIKYDTELVERFRCMTLEQSFAVLAQEYGLGMTAEQIAEEFLDMAVLEYSGSISEKPGAFEYIRRLAEHGVKIAIATSGFCEPCKAAFKRYGIDGCITAYAFSKEVGVDKSNPDIYLLAAERIGVEPCDCMVFEDILMGIRGAKLAGMHTTAVYDDTNRSETDALKAEAERYITDWRELDDFTS